MAGQCARPINDFPAESVRGGLSAPATHSLFLIGFYAQLVIHGLTQLVLTPKIMLCGLDRHVSE